MATRTSKPKVSSKTNTDESMKEMLNQLMQFIEKEHKEQTNPVANKKEDGFIEVQNIKQHSDGSREMGTLVFKTEDFNQATYDDIHTLKQKQTELSNSLIDVSPLLREMRDLVPQIKSAVKSLEELTVITDKNTVDIEIAQKEIEEVKEKLPKPFLDRLKAKSDFAIYVKNIISGVGFIILIFWILMSVFPGLFNLFRTISTAGAR